MSSTNSPCAGCKFLRRKCTNECVFAPYFPPDNPRKFANVHKVFGASNITKILNDISVSHREEAVNSLAFEAQHRLYDPVRGCIGYISELEQHLHQVNSNLINAKTELATLIGPSAFVPIIHHPIGAGPSTLGFHHHQIQMQIQIQQQQMMMMGEQQMENFMVSREQQEMMRRYEQQQQEVQFGACPSMALVPYEQQENSYQIDAQQQQDMSGSNMNGQFQSQIVLHEQQKLGSEEGRSSGPSY